MTVATLPRAEPVEAAGRFEVLNASQLLVMPPPAWWVDGLLPMGGLAVLYGPPGVGKSFLALSWALAMAAHRPWHGRRVLWSPVGYLAAEGAFGLSVRLRAALDAHELDAASLGNDLAVVPESVNLMDWSAVTALGADLRAHCGSAPGLIVVDTLSRAMPGGDENSVKDVSAAIAGADTLRRDTNACVLLVHHTQKVGELERGSSALRGAADTMLALRQEDDRLILEATKQRNAAPIPPLQLRLVPTGASCIVEPVEGPLPVDADLTPARRRLLETVQDVQQDGWAAASVVIRNAAMPERSAFRQLRALTDAGYLERKVKRYALTNRAQQALTNCQTGLAVTRGS